MTKQWIRNAAVAVAAVAVSATTASAQFDFYTTGKFGGSACGVGVEAPVATCTFGGLELTFTGVAELTGLSSYGSGSTVKLGEFQTAGIGDETQISGEMDFTLFIYQVLPSVGSGTAIGSITGQLTRPDPAVGGSFFSSLIWTPNEIVTIAPVTYDLVFDQTLGRGISVSNATTIEANATVTPEPVSMALLGTGLAGLGAARRRRRKQDQTEI